MKNYLNQGRRVRQLERLEGMAKDAGDILKLVTVLLMTVKGMTMAVNGSCMEDETVGGEEIRNLRCQPLTWPLGILAW